MDDAGTTVVLQLTIPWWGWVGLIAALIGVGVWIGRIETNMGSFKKFMDEIRVDIKTLLRLSEPPVQSSSPVVLTEFGEKISATVNAKAWSAEHAPALVDDAKEKEEEFEIFDMCVNYISQQMLHNEKFQRTVRAGAYELGSTDQDVLRVYEVELRDEVLRLLEQLTI